MVFVWRNPFYADSPNWLDGSVQFLMLVVTVKQGKHGQYWLNSLFLFSPFSHWTDFCSPLRYDKIIHLCPNEVILSIFWIQNMDIVCFFLHFSFWSSYYVDQVAVLCNSYSIQYFRLSFDILLGFLCCCIPHPSLGPHNLRRFLAANSTQKYFLIARMFFVTFATKVLHLTFCDKIRQFLI